MRRVLIGCALLVWAVSQTGCHRSLYNRGVLGGCGTCDVGVCDNFGCGGCGKRYWGAYADDPPRPEPCNCCGDWIGSCGTCNDVCGRRAGCGRRWTFLQSMLNDFSFVRGNCCEDECVHHECGCGEVGCGEAGCGAAAGGYSSGEIIMHEGPDVSARSPRGHVRPVGHTTTRVATGRSPAKCNCGRH